MATLYTVFKSTINSSYIMPSGKVLPFYNNIYMTTDPIEIAQLLSDIASGNQYIYQDAQLSDASNTNISNQQLALNNLVARATSDMS